MALSQTSSNVMGNGVSNKTSSKNPHKNASQRSRSRNDCLTSISLTPSSLQSMVKTTTETGDIVQFPINSARAQFLHVREPFEPSRELRSRKISHHAQHRHLGESLRRSREHSSLNVKHQDLYAHSTTQKYLDKLKASDNSLYLPCQSRHELLSRRPQTAYGFPSTLKNSGHRPSSPALSDINVFKARPYSRLNRKTGLGISSPSSLSSSSFGRVITPLMYGRDLDRSYSSTRSSPSPSTPLTAFQNPLLTPIRAHSLKQTPLRDINSISSQDLVSKPASSLLYYDYSEAFEEEPKAFQISAYSEVLIDPPLPKQQVANDYAAVNDKPASSLVDFQTRQENLEKLLASEGCADPESQSKAYRATSEKAVAHDHYRDLTTKPSLRVSEKINPSTSDLYVQGGWTEVCPKGRALFDTEDLVKYSLSRAVAFTPPSIGDSNQSAISTPSSTGFHSITNTPVVPKSSIPKKFSYPDITAKNAYEVGTVNQTRWKSPTLFNPSALDSAAEQESRPSTGTPVLPSGNTGAVHSNIAAPVARSQSIQSHRNRFSRILDIDDNLSEHTLAIDSTESKFRSENLARGRTISDLFSRRVSSLFLRRSFGSSTHLENSGNILNTDALTSFEAERSVSISKRSSVRFDVPLRVASLQQIPKAIQSAEIEDVPAESKTWQKSPSIYSTANSDRTASPQPFAEAIKYIILHDRLVPTTAQGFKLDPTKKSDQERSKECDLFLRPSSPHATLRATKVPFALASNIPNGRCVMPSSPVDDLPVILLSPQNRSTIPPDQIAPKRYKLRFRSEGEPTALPHESQVGNLDSGYPWTSLTSNIDAHPLSSPMPRDKPPRFDLKVTRPSIWTEQNPRLLQSSQNEYRFTRKHEPATKGCFQGGLFKRTNTRSTCMSTDLVLAEDSLQEINKHSVSPSSAPDHESLSPGLELSEVQNGFSDDSSHSQQRTTTRTRFVYFTAKGVRSGITCGEEGHAEGAAHSIRLTKSKENTQVNEDCKDVKAGSSWKVLDRFRMRWQHVGSKIRK